MKRSNALKIISLLLLFILAAPMLVSCGTGSKTGELSSGIGYLREKCRMQKRVSLSEPTMFTLEEFETALGSEVTYIVVSELPSSEFGVLSLRGKPIVVGQTLAAESLGLVMFSPCGKEGASEKMKFYCRDGGFAGNEIECVMTLSDVQAAPTATAKSENAIAGIKRLFSVCDIQNGQTCRIVTYPSHGTITLDKNGNARYLADIDYSGTDIFTYTVTDRYGNASDAAPCYITVAENKEEVVFEDAKDEIHHYAARMCLDGVMTYRLEGGKYYFDPTSEITRIDLLVMLMDAAEVENIYTVTDTVFKDDSALTVGRLSYLAKAAELGIVDTASASFRPLENATRAEAAEMIDKMLVLPQTGAQGAFADLSAVPTGSVSAVCRVIASGIMSVPKGYFYPSSTLTKAEAAEILCRARDYKQITNPRG